MTRAALAGHLWTILPMIVDRLAPVQAPPTEPWEGTVIDPARGPLRLHGRLHRAAGSETLLVIVHGLGGSPDSYYCRRTARAAGTAGISSLRLGLRGADASGEDYPHSALTADLRAALASPALAGFRRLYVIGFSMGGHMSLRAATEEGLDPRVRAVAAVCPPLDLFAVQRHLDRPAVALYRRYLLAGLVAMYEAVARRGPVPIPVEEARRIDTFLEWDGRVVAPRHGFRDAADYYTRAAAGPRLGGLSVPALLVAAENDPMIPVDSLRPHARAAAGRIEACFPRVGGHVGFPPALALGLDGDGRDGAGGAGTGPRRPLEPQVIEWLQAH